MSKFNVTSARPAGRGLLATEAVPSGRTHEGGTGYARDARSELFLRATASFAGEDSFYEDAAVRDERTRELVSGLATDADGFAWLAGFLPWLRDGGDVRSAPVMLAAEAVKARLAAGLDGGNRQLIGSVLRRADEPGEMLAYWMTMVQAAALFGLATGVKNRDRADLFGFADGQFRVERSAYQRSVLKSVEAFTRRIGEVGHGTRIAEAVWATYRGHDRVMIFTDMQTFPDRSGWGGHVGDVSASVPVRIPVYGFNLIGYRHSAMPAGHGNRHELGGLTDATFSLIPNIESGLAARWPWAEAAEVQ
jgi:hypothetical protein